MKACFWIAAGASIGGGHVTRAEALADALGSHGFEVMLLAEDPAAVARAGSARFETEALAGRSFARACSEYGAQLAVVDLPHSRPADPRALDELTDSGVPSVSFDASDPTRDHCDLWVDAVSGGVPKLSPRVLPLLGPRYAVLRSGLGAGSTRKPSASGGPLRLLVGFGASDPARLTVRSLTALEPVADRLVVDVLVGALVPADRVGEIEQAARALPRVELHDGVRDPVAWLTTADLGLFAFGNLFLEAAACGVPSVLWHPTAAHALVAAQFQTHAPGPLAIDLGDANAGGMERLATALTDLLDDCDRRAAMSMAATATVDGRGAERVARAAAARVGG